MREQARWRTSAHPCIRHAGGVGGRVRVTEALSVDPRDVRWRFSRSSGPGGQGVNTTDSHVELLFDVARASSLTPAVRDRLCERLAGRLVDGVLTISCSQERSQWQNRRRAFDQLLAMLTDAAAPPPPARRATRPTRGSMRRRTESKKRRSRTKSLRRRPGNE